MKQQEDHFDEVANEYDESLPPHVVEHLLQRRVELAAALIGSGRVLDVGCGTGVFLERLAKGPFEAVGCDVSEAMVTEAIKRGVQASKAPADALPFGDDEFDLVTSIAVMHHLIDPALVHRAVVEMARVAKPGGTVMIWDHNPSNPYWKILMRRLPQDQGDERLVPARRLVDSLRSAGVQDIEVRKTTFVPDFVPPRALPAVARAERVLERTPGLRLVAAHNVVIGRLGR